MIEKIAGGAICIHLVATMLQNTPDSFNQEMSTFTLGWKVPGWRFFAPTPGAQNVKLMVRSRGRSLGPWKEITPTVPHGWSRALFNPRSRGPKALFDAMQQFTVMASNGVEPEWLYESDPYYLISNFCKKRVAVDEHYYQFLLINEFPRKNGDGRVQPLMVSEWIVNGC